MNGSTSQTITKTKKAQKKKKKVDANVEHPAGQCGTTIYQYGTTRCVDANVEHPAANGERPFINMEQPTANMEQPSINVEPATQDSGLDKYCDWDTETLEAFMSNE